MLCLYIVARVKKNIYIYIVARVKIPRFSFHKACVFCPVYGQKLVPGTTIIYYTLGHVFMSTTNKSTRHMGTRNLQEDHNIFDDSGEKTGCIIVQH